MAACTTAHRRVRLRNVYAHVTKQGFLGSGKPSLQYELLDYCQRCELVLHQVLALRPRAEERRPS